MTNGVVRVIDSVRLRLFDRGHRVTVEHNRTPLGQSPFPYR